MGVVIEAGGEAGRIGLDEIPLIAERGIEIGRGGESPPRGMMPVRTVIRPDACLDKDGVAGSTIPGQPPRRMQVGGDVVGIVEQHFSPAVVTRAFWRSTDELGLVCASCVSATPRLAS